MRVDRTPDAILALVKDQPLRFIPGSKFEYSNTNYVALDTQILPSFVPGYLLTDGGLQNMFHISPNMLYAAGNLYSIIDDLILWDRALHDTDALGLNSTLRTRLFQSRCAVFRCAKQSYVGTFTSGRQTAKSAPSSGGREDTNGAMMKVTEGEQISIGGTTATAKPAAALGGLTPSVPV